MLNILRKPAVPVLNEWERIGNEVFREVNLHFQWAHPDPVLTTLYLVIINTLILRPWALMHSVLLHAIWYRSQLIEWTRRNLLKRFDRIEETSTTGVLGEVWKSSTTGGDRIMVAYDVHRMAMERIREALIALERFPPGAMAFPSIATWIASLIGFKVIILVVVNTALLWNHPGVKLAKATAERMAQEVQAESLLRKITGGKRCFLPGVGATITEVTDTKGDAYTRHYTVACELYEEEIFVVSEGTSPRTVQVTWRNGEWGRVDPELLHELPLFADPRCMWSVGDWSSPERINAREGEQEMMFRRTRRLETNILCHARSGRLASLICRFSQQATIVN